MNKEIGTFVFSYNLQMSSKQIFFIFVFPYFIFLYFYNFI